MSLLLALPVALLAALMVWALRSRLVQLEPGPLWLRPLGGLAGMGLALLGAALLVSGPSLSLGAALATTGPVLAALAVLGGDLLWAGRQSIGAATLMAAATGLATSVLMGFATLAWPVILLTAVIVPQGTWLALSGEAKSRLQRLFSNTEAWMVLLVLAALVRIPVPLWPGGFPLISAVQMGLITLAALLWGWRRIGPRIFLLAAISFALGLIIEIIGSQTGFPFGVYSYVGTPGPTIFGVPIIVPLGWFALVLSAHLLAGGRPWLAGLLVVAWDLGLEALMPSKGYWTWSDPNPLWYGAPVQNYLAWFAVGALISWLFSRLARDLRTASGFAWAYRLEALFLPAGLALLGLWPAALVCGLAMNALAWRWNLRSRRNIEPAS